MKRNFEKNVSAKLVFLFSSVGDKKNLHKKLDITTPSTLLYYLQIFFVQKNGEEGIKMRICLVRPPTFARTSYPYNIECIAMALKEAGHTVSFVDAEYIASQAMKPQISTRIFDRIRSNFYLGRKMVLQNAIAGGYFSDPGGTSLWDDIIAEILKTQPDVIGFSCYSASMSSTAVIVESLRRKYQVKLPVILGGIHPTSAPKETLRMIPGADYAVVGEGEKTIVELVNSLNGNRRAVNNVKGTCFREGGQVKLAEPRELVEDLSEFPVATFEYVNPHYPGPYVILTSRGCPFNCKYCSSKNIWGKRVRFRQPVIVVREIVNLINKTGIKLVRLADDTFTLKKNHMEAVSREVKKAGLHDFNFSVGSRIDTIDKEKTDILKQLGVINITFGVETGSRRMMELIDKNVNPDVVVPTIKMVNDAGIRTHTCFMLNFPGETLADMQDTYRLAKKLVKHCRKNTISLNIGFPYPATPWWDYCQEMSLNSDIDFYRDSYKYNHQQLPAVNMTGEPLGTILTVKKQIERLELSNFIRVKMREASRLVFSDPKRILRKTLRLFK
jgi:magnesium-protoporphyrin IX monomethyl ester (oxidative) cyclase